MENAPDGNGNAYTDDQYVVVARRYRPQSFEDLVGQASIVRALGNAIETNRVGHAYLFTGARGVGKTSTARVLSKALNCSEGPTPKPCNRCDICQSITSGEDMDVIEIDGASNRGIEDIRDLRQNVNVRPSRSRFKVYIIDEVHMLTGPAFNALLKTLEEPPEHVRFIFCTTEPERLPITVRSRCQRYDFAPVAVDEILGRLQQIVSNEQMTADDEALSVIARRAGGSMRDSQSLLEQVMSYCQGHIGLDEVHLLLGTTAVGQLLDILESLQKREAAEALMALDVALQDGAKPEQLIDQLLGLLRDTLAVSVGGKVDILRFTDASHFERISSLAQSWGRQTLLAALEIMQETVRRLSRSVHVRIQLETALIRIASLEDLEMIATLISALESGNLSIGEVTSNVSASQTTKSSAVPNEPSIASSPQTDAQKKTEDSLEKPPSLEVSEPQLTQIPENITEITDANVMQIWRDSLGNLDDLTSDYAKKAESLAIIAPNRLVVRFPSKYNFDKSSCERPERKQSLESALRQATGQRVVLSFELIEEEAAPPAQSQPAAQNSRQRAREVEQHPLIQKAAEVFDAEIVRVDAPRKQT